jgi:hypothetical protein
LDESRPEDIIVVAGSLYLLGEIRPMLEQIALEQAASRGSGVFTLSWPKK